MRASLLVSLLALGPAPEKAEGPPKNEEAGSASRGGTDSGALELGLGSSLFVVGGALVGVGAMAVQTGLARKKECELDRFSTNCTLDPPNLVFASSGLSFAASIPAFVGGALLLVKGVRIHRDYRAYRRLQMSHLQLRLDRNFHGASIGLRF